MRRLMLALSLLVTVAGPGSAGPDTPITDVKSLAGDWRAVGGASPAAIRIKPDGSYEGLAASGAKTVGKVAVVAGKGSYRSTSSEGTVTLSRDGRQGRAHVRARRPEGDREARAGEVTATLRRAAPRPA